MSNFAQQIQNAASYIKTLSATPIDTAIIAGSGLGSIGSNLENTDNHQPVNIQYSDIPHLSPTTAPSHTGKLTIQQINGKNIAICHGRHHLYEGYSPQQVSLLIYALGVLGAKTLIVTNAAGALNEKFQPGDIMLINDHINFTGHNPLVGLEMGLDKSFGNRFTDMSQAYNTNLLAIAENAASQHDLSVHQGIYIGVLGSSLETSAERRMFKAMGADAVGMSTVVEVIAANHCKMNVLGLSAITNLALGDEKQQPDTIEDVLRYADIAGKGIKRIIESVLMN